MAATHCTWHAASALATALAAPTSAITGGDVGQMLTGVPSLALALFVAAIVAFTVRPREPLVRLLALLMFTCGLLVATAPLAAHGYWVISAVESIAQGVSTSLFARFCLAYSRRSERTTQVDQPWYRALDKWGPLVPLILCLPNAAIEVGPPWVFAIASDILYLGLSFGLALGLGSLAWASFHSRRDVSRTQLLVVALGAAIGGLPPLGLTVVPKLLFNQPIESFAQSEYGLLALPLCLGFALVRWRTVSLLSLIDRVSVYAVLGIVLLACYGALALGLARLEGASVGSMTTMVSFAVAIVVAATFGPLRDRVQRAVDTVLYRDYYDLGPTVQHFSQSLAAVREQQAVVTSLLDDLCDTLNLSGAALIQLPGGLDPAILPLLEADDLVARRAYLPQEVRRCLVQALAALDPKALRVSSREPVVISPFPGCAALVVIGPGTGEDASALLLIGSKRGGGQLRPEDRALLGTVAHQAATALENATLIGGLRTTLSQLRRSTEQLEDARSELQLLLREMVDADERQRASLARDIHDVALQDLMFVSRSSSYCLTRFQSLMDHDTDRSPEAQRLAKELVELTKVATSAESELRNVITGLYPAMIESLGLLSALETLAEEASPGHALTIAVECDPVAEQMANELDRDIRLHIYRIAQEAIRNASKHAGASRVAIALRVSDEPHRGLQPEKRAERTWLLLTIDDDGAGIPLPIDYVGLLRDRHLGLASMRDRAERVGAQLSIRHGAAGGTQVEVRIRLRQDYAAASGWAPARRPEVLVTPLLAESKPRSANQAGREHVGSRPAAAARPKEGRT